MSGSTDVELPSDTTLPVEPAEVVVADPPERELSPREKALEAIYASRATVVANELGVAKDIGFAVPEETPGEEEDAPREEQGPAAATTAGHSDEPLKTGPREAKPVQSAAPVQPSEAQFHEIEIEGQRFRVDDAQLRELARIGALANLAVSRQQHAPQAPEPAPVAPAVPAIADDAAKTIYQRIVFGTPEDGEAAVRDLAALVAPRQPQIDANQIATAVEQRVQQKIQLESNLQIIAREYSDIFNDTSLSQLAALKLSEARNEFAARGEYKSDLDLYREACNRVHRVLGRQPQSAVETAPPVLQAAPAHDRLERKRAAPRNPTAVSRSAGVAIEGPRPPTNAEIVDRIRRSRGQPSVLN